MRHSVSETFAFPQLQVLDARDPEGTRCRHLEQHLRKNARHKHLLLLLNKCDLVRHYACASFQHENAFNLVFS